MFHKTDGGIKAHLNLAVLAYRIVSVTKYRLRMKDYPNVRWDEIMRIAQAQVVVTAEMETVDGDRIRVRQSTEAEEELAVITASAQQKGYVCTGNNVNVRTRPSTNYPVYDNDGVRPKRQLSKGDVVLDEGKRKNGFCLISGPLAWGGDERDGWVSAKYLQPVKICPTCGGTKDENVGKVDIDLITCRKCKGRGYLK